MLVRLGDDLVINFFFFVVNNLEGRCRVPTIWLLYRPVGGAAYLFYESPSGGHILDAAR